MERELKFALRDRLAYETLLGAFPARPAKLQKNYYFDSSSGCLGGGPPGNGAGRSALRIRGEGLATEGDWAASAEWEMTLKLGVSQEGAYFQAHEWNAPMIGEKVPALLCGGEWPDDIWELEPLLHFLEFFPRQPMVYLGGLDNLRTRCPLFQGEIAEIDQTTFSDGSVDYEVEVETEQPAEVEAYLHELAAKLGISLVAQTRTKFRRFLERQTGR